MRRTKAAPDPGEIERALASVRRIIASEGSLARSKLSKLGLPKGSQAEAIEQLEREGVEVMPKLLRVPLETQLDAALRDGAVLSLRSIHNAVSGGNKREVAAAARALVRADRALLVMRGKELVLSAPRSDVLTDKDLAQLERTVSALGKTVKDARKNKATLLQADVRDALAPFTLSPRPRMQTADVLVEARKHALAGGLVFVPALVRALGGNSARAAVHDALRDAANRGLVELRPESGLGRLSEEDLAFCIPGPQGSHLSWARPIEEAR